MTPTPSPLQATPDQEITINWLEMHGRGLGIQVDAGPLDVPATEGCSNDWAHGPGTVCLPDDPDRICPTCALGWLRWQDGPQVAVDVLRVLAVTVVAA